MPTVRSNPYAHTSEFELPQGWMEAPSIQVVLEALRLLHQQSGDRLVIVGKMMGPWTLSYYMMGMEEFLVATKLEPERARACMNTLKVVTLAIARAQIQAGADIIYLADHASGGIVSPRASVSFCCLYTRRYLAPLAPRPCCTAAGTPPTGNLVSGSAGPGATE